MQITVKLPDDLAQHPNAGREALEALALEGYRSGKFSRFETSQLLELSRFEFDALLKQRNVLEGAYDVEDLEQDLRSLDQLYAKGHL